MASQPGRLQGKFGGIKTKPAHPVHRHSMCADRSEKSEVANTLKRDGPPKGEKMVVVVVDKSHLCCGKLPIALGFQKGFFGGWFASLCQLLLRPATCALLLLSFDAWR